MNSRLPLVPEDRYRQPPRAPAHLQRAAWAAVKAAVGGTHGRDPTRWAAALWRDDEVTPLLLQRAAVTGANTTTPAWAGLLAQRQVGEWLGSLAPASAAAELIRRGVTLSLSGWGSIGIPVQATAPTAIGFVDEQGAIPMRSWAFTTVEFGPACKMAVIVAFSKWLAEGSEAQAIFEAVLREEAALSLDTAYFSTDDGSVAGHHAGLLDGLVAGTGTAVMADDLAALAAAVGAGGSGQVVYIMGPGRAAATALRIPAEVTATVLPSLAVPEDRIIAVDPTSLVHGVDPTPEITASEEAVLHMETVPLDIATGAPGSAVLATPTQSMFQTNQIAMRLLVDIAFVKRRANAVAYLDGATW